jgi:hypothetical protein
VQCLTNTHCNDGNACTTNTCTSGSCSSTNVTCGDGDVCKSWFCDSATGCGFTNITCEDNNECTSNVCDSALGCTFPNLADGTPCSIGTCQTGVCTAPPPDDDPRVFRMNQLVLVDPHTVAHTRVYIALLLGNCTICRDITYADIQQRCQVFLTTQTLDLPGLNPALNALVTEDGNGDGYLDLSFMIVSDPHVQTHQGRGTGTVTEGLCLAADQTDCIPDPAAVNTVTTDYTSLTSGTCLTALPGTTGPVLAQVAPNTVTAPCFVSDSTVFTISLEFDGQTFAIPLSDVRLAGRWVGDPATAISNGLLRGFLPMETADQLNITLNISLVGDVVINLGKHILPDHTGGGAGAHGCGNVNRTHGPAFGTNAHVYETNPTSTSCPSSAGDARDLLNTGGAATYTNCGWYFHINWTGIWAENATGF